MLKTVFRKSCSVLLALALILTSFCLADPSSLFPTADASVSTAKSDDIAPVTFVVPETIYLTPTWDCYNADREMSFQWYVNNTVNADGSITCDTGEDSVGDIYFNYQNADSVKIKFEWLDEDGVSSLGGRITFGDSTERYAGAEFTMVPSKDPVHITSGMSPSIESTVTGVYLRWIATFFDKSDNRSKTVMAYTYVYKPYPQPVGAAIHSRNNRGTDSYGDIISWVSGVHDTDTANIGTYYPNTALSSEGKGMMPFSSSFNAGVTIDKLNAQFASATASTSRFFYTDIVDLSPDTWLNQSAGVPPVPDMSFHYLNNEIDTGNTGDYAVSSVNYSPNAVLTVDTSRYTNLNQIPNLSVGLMGTRDKGTKNSGAWFVANYTGTPASSVVTAKEKNATATGEALWAQYSAGSILASAGHYSNDTANSKGWAANAEKEGVKYNGRWTRAISSASDTGLYMVSTGYFNHDSDDSTDHYGGDTIWNYSELRTYIHMLDKTFLRSTVQKAIANSAMLSSSLYDTSSTYWKNYSALYHAANMALTKVDGTVSVNAIVGDKSVEYTTADAVATALDTAITALLNGNGRVKGTVTQTNVALQRLENGSYKCVELLGGETVCSASITSIQTVTLTPEICPGYTFVGALKTQQVPTFSIGAAVTYPNAFTTSATGAVFSEDGTITYPRAGTSGTDNRGNIYYTFYYVPNTYSVVFNGNGGSGTSTEQFFVYNDPQALNANTFTKRGYVFAGWATNPEGTGTIYADEALVSDLTTEKDGIVNLYAVWEKAVYTIKLDPTGGTIVGSYDTTYTIESNVILPYAEKNGLTLSGWKANDSGNWGPLSYDAGTPLPAGKYGDVTLYAEWKANGYTVSFNGNGANGGSMANQSFVYGTSQALSPNAFVRTGYSFLGWASTSTAKQIQYSDKQIVINLTATPDAVVPLFAVWSPNTYTITYNTDGGTIRDSDFSKSYTIEDAITLPATVEKTGYIFAGWQSATNAGNWTIGITYNGTITAGMYGGVTFNAQWSLAGYTILYNADGGTISGTGYTTSYNVQSTITLPSAQKTGYSFGGWVADGSGNWGTDTYVAGNVSAGKLGNVTLKAVWSGITYYISFDGNHSTDGSMLIQPMTYGKSAKLNTNTYTRTGYSFLGWSATNNATAATYLDGAAVQDLSTTAGSIVTLYAVWSSNAYTITYDTTGGTITDSVYTTGYSVSDAVVLPAAARAGYVFDGWMPAQNSGSWSVQSVYSGTLAAGDAYGSVRLAAQWTPESYTITYVTGGGTITGNATYTYDITSTVTLPAATRPGYAFGGWQVSGWDNGVYPAGTYSEKVGNVTLTALWNARQYTVHFDGNGATAGSMSDQTFYFDIEQALSTNVFSRPGFNFAGWSLTKGGDSTYADGAKVLNLAGSENAVITLYACWNGAVFSINYDMNGASGSMIATSVIMEGSAVTLRENKNTEVEIGGTPYTFSGWAFSETDADSGIVDLENMASFSLKEADLDTLDINWSGTRPVIKLYAVWTEVEIAACIDVEGSKAVVAPESGFIYGLKIGVTEQEIVDEYIRITGKAHLEFEYIGYVGTGTIVRLVSDVTGEVLETYTLVIFGDLNGDGLVNNQDIVIAKSINAQTAGSDFSAAVLFAADLFEDNNVNNSDITIMKNMQSNLIALNQATREQTRTA